MCSVIDDILRGLIETDLHTNDELKSLEKQIAEAKKQIKFEQKFLLEDQHFYTYILDKTKAKYPPSNDKIYDYLISLFSDRHLEDPDPDLKVDYPMRKPDMHWLWSNMDPDLPWFRIWFTWRKDQTERPDYDEVRKAFMMMSRQEQVRLIQLYNTEDRQDRLNWNLKMQLKHTAALQHYSAKVIELQSELSKLQKERATRIVQALQTLESPSRPESQHDTTQIKHVKSRVLFHSDASLHQNDYFTFLV